MTSQGDFGAVAAIPSTMYPSRAALAVLEYSLHNSSHGLIPPL